MQSKTIQKAVIRHYKYFNHIALENIYLYDWESDVLSINGQDEVFEFEVKVSRSDYKRDAEKKMQHYNISSGDGYGANYFYYVCPTDMVELEEIPTHAGLIYCDDKGKLRTIKEAPLLHSEPLSNKNWKELAKKMFFKYIA